MDKLLFRRILVAGLTALAIIYVVYLLLSANFNVIPTENAEQVTVTDKIYSNGYIIVMKPTSKTLRAELFLTM